MAADPIEAEVAEIRRMEAEHPKVRAIFDQVVVMLRDDMKRHGVDLADPVQRHAVKMAASCMFAGARIFPSDPGLVAAAIYRGVDE